MIAAGTQRITLFQVQEAWDAYKALQATGAIRPALLDNDYFTCLQDTAYARFKPLYSAWDGRP